MARLPDPEPATAHAWQARDRVRLTVGRETVTLHPDDARHLADQLATLAERADK